MTLDDAEHYTPAQKAAIIASYPEHELDARTKGIPTLGSGRIFPVAEDAIACDAVEIAPHWPQIGGMDFGIDHPFAAVSLAWDRDADCVYVTRAYRQKGATPIVHVPAVKPWADWLPWAWPHDGLQRDKGSARPLAEQYGDLGLKMLPEPATYEDARSNGVEAGLMDMLTRMQTSRWRVFRHLNDWFGEFRLYHRKDGLVVKEADDLMSASRYALMMLRHAKVKPRPIELHLPPAGASWMA